MDADKLANFGTIKTAHGEVEALLCIFFFQGLLSLYIRKSFSGISMYCWANRIALSNIPYDIDG